MKILVLGGSQYIGRRLVQRLLAAGHAVTLFNRGLSAATAPPGAEHLIGDRDAGAAGLAALAAEPGRRWDACVDFSGYTATHLQASSRLLRGRVGHCVYMSAVSVYGDPPSGPVDEATPLQPPEPDATTEVDGRSYGRLKVRCEQIVQAAFGEQRCALLRPQVVAGPGDPVDRLSYWVRRAQQPGPMLAPGDGHDPLQFIDVDDVAAFAQRACEEGLAGPFNLAGPRLDWAGFLPLLGGPPTHWVPAEVIEGAGLAFGELPLWRRRGGPRSSLMQVDAGRALQQGLQCTPTADTIARTRAWLATGAGPAPALSPERERWLLGLAGRVQQAARSP